jgi:hypothetical protein
LIQYYVIIYRAGSLKLSGGIRESQRPPATTLSGL